MQNLTLNPTEIQTLLKTLKLTSDASLELSQLKQKIQAFAAWVDEDCNPSEIESCNALIDQITRRY